MTNYILQADVILCAVFNETMQSNKTRVAIIIHIDIYIYTHKQGHPVRELTLNQMYYQFLTKLQWQQIIFLSGL